MSKKRNVIGEGSFGCVHKPSIQCKTIPKPGFDYRDYVSKIMKNKNAHDELNEFVTIGAMDPENEYHLGTPILCSPDLAEINVKQDIAKCKHIDVTQVTDYPDNYKLLILKYGGPDLKSFCIEHIEQYLKKNKQNQTDIFWLEVHNLLKGLKFFKDNDIIHNDLKPQNILFNTKTGKLKYIDFGLMRTKQEVINSSKTNTNGLGIYHWSFPFDCGLMNKDNYDKYYNSNKIKREFWKNEFTKLLVDNSGNNSLDLPINKPKAFKILFTYLSPTFKEPTDSIQYGYINSFFDGFDEIIKNENYNKALLHTVDSIDVFGLGFSLQYIANCFKKHNALTFTEFSRLSGFFHKMYDFNPNTRVIDLDILLNDYENILFEFGILTRLGKYFVKNNLHSASSNIMRNVNINVNNVSPLYNKDPILSISKTKCKDNQEINPFTKRCIKKCKHGFVRNDKFKCITNRRKSHRINFNTRTRTRAQRKS